MKYGFVTYTCANDAFKAIESGNRLPSLSMYDISFGGRRAFCRSNYSDLGKKLYYLFSFQLFITWTGSHLNFQIMSAIAFIIQIYAIPFFIKILKIIM